MPSKPCMDKQKKIMNCYIENKSEPLKCSDVVKSFVECVDLKRSVFVQEHKG